MRSAERSPPRRRARPTRSAVSPPPRCTTAHAKAKWSGAPPRSRGPCPQHVAERAAADEERERLVLVRRPGAEEPAEHARAAQPSRPRPARSASRGKRVRHARRRQTGDAGLSFYEVQADSTASVLNLVPTYEYKCPNGHVFEVFKRMADPPPDTCPVCGASPGRDGALSRARCTSGARGSTRPTTAAAGARRSSGEGIGRRSPDPTRARATRRTRRTRPREEEGRRGGLALSGTAGCRRRSPARTVPSPGGAAAAPRAR